MAVPFTGSPSGSGDTIRRSPPDARAAAVDAWHHDGHLRNLLSAPETAADWYWLSDLDNVRSTFAGQKLVFWGTAGMPATMAMLCWDEWYQMFYIGTYTPDMHIRRFYIDPMGGNPVYEWLKIAIRYFIVRSASESGNNPRRPTSIPDQYFREDWLIMPAE